MGVRITADRLDPALFSPQQPAPEPQTEETEEPTPVQQTTETDEAEATRDAAETEETENDAATQQAPAPGGQTDLPPSPFGPRVPGGNLNIVA